MIFPVTFIVHGLTALNYEVFITHINIMTLIVM